MTAAHPHSGTDHHHMANHHAGPPTKPPSGPTTADPVCGMTVTVKADTRTGEFAGNTFHFCSARCQAKFKADPWFYASGRAVATKATTPAAVQCTCPMHPQIIRDAPGTCPICGMAL